MVELHTALNNILGFGGVLGGDVSDEVAGAIKATGSVESLNFASGVIPGFGPVFQLGVKQFVPDDPKNDWIRELVAPFGTSGGLANQFSPAWVKRILSAQGAIDDPALTYTMNSTLMDVMRTMIDRGDFAGVTSRTELNALLAKVEDEAKGLMMVRAAATWWNPASPSYQFQKEDINGMQWSFSNLGQEFRKLEDELGDEGAAFDEFYRRFGFLPQAFRGGKTYSVLDRSLTEAGSKFERANSALFNEYPATAMYIDPSISGASEYDHAAMLSQLERGLREQWTIEQYAYMQQDQLGDLWYDNANRIAAAMPSAESKAFLLAVSDEIRSKYPLWNERAPGKVQGATNEQQLGAIQRMIAAPDLAGSPALAAASRYEALRQEILVQIIRAGAASISGPKSPTTDAGRIATYGRNELRAYAEELTLQYPEFGPLFKNVYSWEVNVGRDAIEPVIIDAFGEGDIMSDLGVAG